MQHLLPGDSEDRQAPAFDGLQLADPKTGTGCALEAERGVEVLAHQGMLKLSSLAQKVGELLTALHHNGRLSPHQGNVPPEMAVFNGGNIRGQKRRNPVREVPGASRNTTQTRQ
jgi:hypothetical protein